MAKPIPVAPPVTTIVLMGQRPSCTIASDHARIERARRSARCNGYSSVNPIAPVS
jgi:hypothetical protein